ncbi:MAG: winged helix DNA-binding domain-containing protein [Candidatus Cloacimonetes bacterium]|nr:winged helix DNA-binding domain-containing protein [Candidatus Cloacimonadota bacterium]
MDTLSKAEARNLALHAQLLTASAPITSGKNGVYEIIDHLGYVQLDTLSVVKRAHHHTLWNRQPDYNPDMLLELQRDDKLIFEYWGHAASYLPMKDYRFYQHRMNNADDPNSKWEKERLDKYGYLLEPIMAEVRKKGPCQAKDLELPGISFKKGKNLPWESTQVRFALNMLVFMGQLMIAERKKFQKYYDLTERVLPLGIDTTLPSHQELGRFLVTRALKSYGIATAKDIRDHIFLASTQLIQKTIKEMLRAHEIIDVSVEGDEKSTYYTLPSTIEYLKNILEPKRTIILSPFDNLIILRDRMKRLFDFKYALECYVPPNKRIDGYFVCPILWKNRLVGRLDPKADRKSKKLILKNIVFENDFDEFDEFLPDFEKALKEFRDVNECKEIVVEKKEQRKRLKGLKV